MRRDVRAEAPSGLRRLDPAAAPLTGVLGRDRLPALAELGVRPQPAAELEVDREPVRVVAEERVEDRLETLLGEQGAEALVVPRREAEEELFLRGRTS